MKVEVTEQNIIIYGLVQLTGNTAADMLQAAKEAQDKGYTLTCDIPDDQVNMNLFDAAGSTPSPVEHREPRTAPFERHPGEFGGREVEVHFVQVEADEEEK